MISLFDQPPVFLGSAIVVAIVMLFLVWSAREASKLEELGRRNLVNSVRANNHAKSKIRFDGRMGQCRRASEVAEALGWSVCNFERKSFLSRSVWFAPASDESASRSALLQAFIDADLVHEIALPEAKKA